MVPLGSVQAGTRRREMERYERLKVLGVGSFGKVYLMRHRQERRLVCAKIIKIKNIPRKEREACRTEVSKRVL